MSIKLGEGQGIPRPLPKKKTSESVVQTIFHSGDGVVGFIPWQRGIFGAEEYLGAAGAPVLGDARPSSAPPNRPTKPPTAAPTSPRGRKSEKRLGFGGRGYIYIYVYCIITYIIIYIYLYLYFYNHIYNIFNYIYIYLTPVKPIYMGPISRLSYPD